MTLFVIQSFDIDPLLIWLAANTKNLSSIASPLKHKPPRALCE